MNCQNNSTVLCSDVATDEWKEKKRKWNDKRRWEVDEKYKNKKIVKNFFWRRKKTLIW